MSDKAAYGLGLFVAEDRGVQVISHGVNTLGFTADVFFVPGANVGGVILTNAQSANAFTGAIREKLMELWFGASPRAETMIELAIKQHDSAVKKLMERTTLPPDPTFTEPLLGTWRNAQLGEVKIAQTAQGPIVDVGEWKSPFGRYVEVDGTMTLILAGPPLAGFPLQPQTVEGRRVLMLDSGQQKYLFERAAR